MPVWILFPSPVATTAIVGATSCVVWVVGFVVAEVADVTGLDDAGFVITLEVSVEKLIDATE
jgi:hypothetical protein